MARQAEYPDQEMRQIKLAMPQQEADALQAYCKENGLKVAPLLRELIKSELDKAASSKDGLGPVSEQMMRSKEIKKEEALLLRQKRMLEEREKELIEKKKELGL